MLKPLLVSALFAGLIAGLFAAGLQLAFTVPLIAEAELYESGEVIHFTDSGDPSWGMQPEAGNQGDHDHGAEGHGAEGHGAEGHGAEGHGAEGHGAEGHGAADAHAHGNDAHGDGIARHLLTILNTVLISCGFGLLIVAAFALAERWGLARIDMKAGLMFGLAGFAATQMMPALGLSPELPGSAAGGLVERQMWWLGTVIATSAGLALLVFGGPAAKAAGAVLIGLPHVIGAPHPDNFHGVVPPEIAALFAARVLVIGALAWAVLGALAGHFWSRESAA